MCPTQFEPEPFPFDQEAEEKGILFLKGKHRKISVQRAKLTVDIFESQSALVKHHFKDFC